MKVDEKTLVFLVLGAGVCVYFYNQANNVKPDTEFENKIKQILMESYKNQGIDTDNMDQDDFGKGFENTSVLRDDLKRINAVVNNALSEYNHYNMAQLIDTIRSTQNPTSLSLSHLKPQIERLQKYQVALEDLFANVERFFMRAQYTLAENEVEENNLLMHHVTQRVEDIGETLALISQADRDAITEQRSAQINVTHNTYHEGDRVINNMQTNNFQQNVVQQALRIDQPQPNFNSVAPATPQMPSSRNRITEEGQKFQSYKGSAKYDQQANLNANNQLVRDKGQTGTTSPSSRPTLYLEGPRAASPPGGNINTELSNILDDIQNTPAPVTQEGETNVGSANFSQVRNVRSSIYSLSPIDEASSFNLPDDDDTQYDMFSSPKATKKEFKMLTPAQNPSNEMPSSAPKISTVKEGVEDLLDTARNTLQDRIKYPDPGLRRQAAKEKIKQAQETLDKAREETVAELVKDTKLIPTGDYQAKYDMALQLVSEDPFWNKQQMELKKFQADMLGEKTAGTTRSRSASIASTASLSKKRKPNLIPGSAPRQYISADT